MQKWIATGNITKEPAITMSKAGKPICNFTIAVRQDYKTDGEYKSDFFNCVAFGATAEYIGNYLVKDNKCAVVGKLQNESWEKDGVKHYMTKIICEQVEGLTPRAKDNMESFGKPLEINEDSIPF